MKIALDAMGGDFGPPNLVGGAVLALREYSQIDKLFLVGDAGQIETELKENAWLVVDANDAIVFGDSYEDKWLRAIRTLGLDPSQLSYTAGRA